MSRTPSKRRYSIGELVTAAYKEAGRVTRDPQVAAILASRTLASWLVRSSHPEVLLKMQGPPS